ncbi:MAG TPA: thioredoxin family protein [Miltoncostaeaceae bacterium]|nr:thioredoxin family protein [Miltoncostaeaceae bacterium]
MTLALGADAPPFRLPTTAGTSVDLAELGDAEVVVVAFWCNHCPYVQAWEERFNLIAQDYSDHRVAVVAINANDPLTYPADDFPAMVERARERDYAFAYAQDVHQDVARAYGAQRTPELFVLDRDRRVRYHGAIDDAVEAGDVTANWLRDALDALLAGREPEVTDTPPVGCTVKWRR